MTVRYRLLTIVGTLFLAIFFSTFGIESHLAAKGAAKVRSDLLQFDKDMEEKTRKGAEHLLSTYLAQRMASLRTLLAFMEEESATFDGSLLQAGKLFVDRQNISLYQKMADKALGPCITYQQPMSFEVKSTFLTQEICWVEHGGKEYIGALAGDPLDGMGCFLCYDVGAVSQAAAFLSKKRGGRALDLFSLRLKQAVSAKRPLKDNSPQQVMPCGGCSNFSLKSQQDMGLRYALLQLCRLKVDGLAAEGWPKVTAFLPIQGGQGAAFEVSSVIRDKEFISIRDGSNQKAEIFIINDPVSGAYVAVSKSSKEHTTLSLGSGLNVMAEELSLAFLRDVYIAFKGEVIVSYPVKEGEEAPNLSQDKLQQMLASPLGVITINHIPYYYMHCKPSQELGLDFFLLQKAGAEFTLMEWLYEQVVTVFGDVARQRRYVLMMGVLLLIILLVDLSKKITDPIVKMAEAARKIARGGLKETSLPIFHLGKRNEVQQLSTAFSSMIQGLKDRERLRGVLDKVVSHDIAGEILSHDIHLGGEDRVVTILFADIRNFTRITQAMQPDEVVELVNSCMSALSKVIEAHKGVIDKYIGDEVMVLFGAPIARPKSALAAVECALAIIEALHLWNVERRRQGKVEVAMGIGIHTGSVCAGNMGAEDRLNYTVIGSSVNLAARLCSAAKPMQVLASEATYSECKDDEALDWTKEGEQPFKGFDAPITVYSITKKRMPL